MKKIHIVYPEKIASIAPEIYGHFSEHIGGLFYDGLWVGKDSKIPNIRGFRKELVDKFKKINPPVLRWPGGCFAEAYDWRDGIGENRPERLNWWYCRDHRTETNEVGTHEFLDFCDMVGTKPYFAVNVSSLTAMQMRDWVDYCLSPKGRTTLAREREKNGHPEPFRIPYWGIGNENWGGGGNMTADFYALEYRRFATIMDNAMQHQNVLIAGGANSTDYNWTHDLAQNLSTSNAPVHGMSFHFYTGGPYEALDVSENAWYETLARAQEIEDAIKRHYAIAEGFGMQEKLKLVIDEWGCWYPEGSGPSAGYNLFEQQSSMKDAVVAALSLNIFNNHSDKILMTNVAQLCNNLHCLFLAHEEHCITTPTYHVFDLYKDHQGADALKTIVENNDEVTEKISVSASAKGNQLLVTLANLSLDKPVSVSLDFLGTKVGTKAKARILSEEDPSAHNTFEAPEAVVPSETELEITKELLIPKASVIAISADIL